MRFDADLEGGFGRSSGATEQATDDTEAVVTGGDVSVVSGCAGFTLDPTGVETFELVLEAEGGRVGEVDARETDFEARDSWSYGDGSGGCEACEILGDAVDRDTLDQDVWDRDFFGWWIGGDADETVLEGHPDVLLAISEQGLELGLGCERGGGEAVFGMVVDEEQRGSISRDPDGIWRGAKDDGWGGFDVSAEREEALLVAHEAAVGGVKPESGAMIWSECVDDLVGSPNRFESIIDELTEPELATDPKVAGVVEGDAC